MIPRVVLLERRVRQGNVTYEMKQVMSRSWELLP